MVHRRWCVIAGCLVSVMVLSVIGAEQSLDFEWDANLHILPDVSMDYVEFEIDYTYGDWQFMTDLKYSDMQFVDLSFQIDGTIGPYDFDGGLVFDPLLAEGYDASYFEVKASPWLSTNVSFKAQHYAEWTSNSLTGSYLLSTLKGIYKFSKTTSLSTTIKLENFRGAGTAFKDVSVALNGLGLRFMCDESLFGATLSMSSDGFESVSLSGKDIVAIPNFMEFDFAITYGVDYKSVSLKPSLVLPSIFGCLEIYQQLLIDPDHPLSITGFAIYGVKASINIGECTGIQFGTAFGPRSIPGGLKNDEFEYIKAKFCGPGCCGSPTTGGFDVYFKPVGVPLGISRVVATAVVPVTAGFSVTMMFESPGTLDIGWELAF
ncbi:hypothetical protein ACFLS0_01690 [Candidatus Bipolaricaulota bacterium]